MNSPLRDGYGVQFTGQCHKVGKWWLNWVIEDLTCMIFYGGKDLESLTDFLKREWTCCDDITAQDVMNCMDEIIRDQSDAHFLITAMRSGPDGETLRRTFEIRTDIEAYEIAHGGKSSSSRSSSNGDPAPPREAKCANGKWADGKFITNAGRAYTPPPPPPLVGGGGGGRGSEDGDESWSRKRHGGGGPWLRSYQPLRERRGE